MEKSEICLRDADMEMLTGLGIVQLTGRALARFLRDLSLSSSPPEKSSKIFFFAAAAVIILNFSPFCFPVAIFSRGVVEETFLCPGWRQEEEGVFQIGCCGKERVR